MVITEHIFKTSIFNLLLLLPAHESFLAETKDVLASLQSLCYMAPVLYFYTESFRIRIHTSDRSCELSSHASSSTVQNKVANIYYEPQYFQGNSFYGNENNSFVSIRL